MDSREICFAGLSRALADVGVMLDPRWYWPREAIASPDLLVLWKQQFGSLPEAIDEIVVRCRTYVMAAADQLIVLDEYVGIAKAARYLMDGSSKYTPSADLLAGDGSPVIELTFAEVDKLLPAARQGRSTGTGPGGPDGPCALSAAIHAQKTDSERVLTSSRSD